VNDCSCLECHWGWRCLQASALVTNQKCSLHIPYCCLTECIRGPKGEWTYGLHMDQEFLSNKQEKSDADKQREMWGLDEANSWMWPHYVYSVMQCKKRKVNFGRLISQFLTRNVGFQARMWQLLLCCWICFCLLNSSFLSWHSHICCIDTKSLPCHSLRHSV
jgi:hypothetical protein